MKAADPLSTLRDLHTPPEPGWWPPAPLYEVLTLLIVFTGLAFWCWRVYRRRPSLRTAARAELRRIRRQYQGAVTPGPMLGELAVLLRRVAMARHGQAVAGLSGDAWAQYLARCAPPGCDPAAWPCIAIERYQTAPAPSADWLLRQCGRWLDHATR